MEPSELKNELLKNGYLLAKNLLSRDKVLKARETVLSHLDNLNILNRNQGHDVLREDMGSKAFIRIVKLVIIIIIITQVEVVEKGSDLRFKS